LLLLSALTVGIGCEKKDEQTIRTYSAPKDTPAPTMVDAGTAPDAEAPASPAAESPAQTAMQWTLPAGWTEVASTEPIRYATIQVATSDPTAQVTVSRMPGGQDVAANLGRWADQIKLPHGSDAELMRFVTHAEVAAMPAELVDMTGPAASGAQPRRLLVTLVRNGRWEWFFKLEAPAPLVAAQKLNFDQFVQSVRFSDATEASPEPPQQASEPARQSSGLARWKAPAGWVEAPNTTMRLLSFRVGPQDSGAEMYVVKLAAGQFGNWQDNVNRWRREAGLEPLDDVSSVKPASVQIGQNEAQLFDFTGPARQELVGYLVRGQWAWFFKLRGPAEVVAGQKAPFLDFLKSVQFE